MLTSMFYPSAPVVNFGQPAGRPKKEPTPDNTWGLSKGHIENTEAFSQGKSLSEIAEQRGVTKEAVDKSIKSALNKAKLVDPEITSLEDLKRKFPSQYPRLSDDEVE